MWLHTSQKCVFKASLINHWRARNIKYQRLDNQERRQRGVSGGRWPPWLGDLSYFYHINGQNMGLWLPLEFQKIYPSEPAWKKSWRRPCRWSLTILRFDVHLHSDNVQHHQVYVSHDKQTAVFKKLSTHYKTWAACISLRGQVRFR